MFNSLLVIGIDYFFLDFEILKWLFLLALKHSCEFDLCCFMKKTVCIIDFFPRSLKIINFPCDYFQYKSKANGKFMPIILKLGTEYFTLFPPTWNVYFCHSGLPYGIFSKMLGSHLL